ncbi:FAD-binding oxidoreductase [Arthrobacter sp. M4]|uniref:NAD(P)/FAD-dependent oxidoreductase n=1 Tax=Arthrobacter sp. M4 TaxID=218160 RepID=UPI001CDBE00E|nr:FAD-binding oxidoreductase [Arthrobacter sp. M4]MCA4134826.1 FAD-binding oxidoreductase [Arthrobacter sp. M4]
MSTSVLIVGGGLVGTSSAYFAAREGLNVTLLEQKHVGYGASGRNPGFVWLHCRNPGWALNISLKGRALYDQLRQDLPVPFEFRTDGGLIYFYDERQEQVFKEFVAARQTDGLDMSLIDGKEVRSLVGPIREDVVGASFCSNDAQINTPTVVAALAAGARAEGATLREGITVSKLIFSGERIIGVETNEGNFFADKVVIASGAWTEKLMKASGLDVPVGRERLQVMATKPLPPQIMPVVYGPNATKAYSLFRNLPSWDDELFRSRIEEETGYSLLTLAAQRANGEILIGCPMDYPAEVDLFPSLDGLKALAEDIIGDFPGLAKVGIDRVWAGVLPFTSDMVPVIDEIAPGLVMAAGHVFGNSAGPMTGKLISQLLTGAESELDMTEVRWNRQLDPVIPGASVNW